MMRDVHAIVSALVDPEGVVTELQLGAGMRRQMNGVMIRCPVHDDSTPSCSVQLVRDRILWCCHGCGEGGDVLALVAAAYDLDRRGKFRLVVDVAAKIAGDLASSGRARVCTSAKMRAPSYPAEEELENVWNEGDALEFDRRARAWCKSRGLDAGHLDDWNLARVLSHRSRPPWAICGRRWSETGHRLLVPAYDSQGVMRSLRARDVTQHGTPKELSPRGHTTKGLVLANASALRMLAGGATSKSIVISEGTPDFLTWATRTKDPVIGILGGVGLPRDVADKIPTGARVAVRVDRDSAGRKYEAEILDLLSNRCLPFVAEDAP